ncbi:MAG: cytochrome P460 family protein [Polyangiales bacterium]
MRTHLLPLLLAAAGCHATTHPAPSSSTSSAAAPTAASVTVPPLGEPPATALPTLFARLQGCAGATGRVGLRWSREGGGALSVDELRARPWLWGQSGSGCAELDDAAGAGLQDASVALSDGPARDRAPRVAERYLRWGRVDDLQRWAPFLCRLPPGSHPRADLDLSAAPHGRKLYYLYARDREAYLTHRDVEGQVVVKEAWIPREIRAADAVEAGGEPQSARGADGRVYEPGEFAGLYVMMRGAPREESDEGWTYATVNPRGEVTAAGRVASCMGCHREAPHGRLFGLARAP